jgi:tripartite-type tricarboxylate transporter receptor subunit TctC
MRLYSLIFTGAIAAACILVQCTAGSADTISQFYAGKTISLMIGYSPGGTDDLWARLIAERLGRYIPGHPAVVPTNVPGAGSLLLANQIYNTQPQDGSVIGLINRGLPFEKLLGGPGVMFSPQKMNWIGSPDRDTTICAARKDAAVQKLSDLETKELVVGATGAGADTAIYPSVLRGLLGLKFKIVTGYPGSHDVSLAMEKGEVQGECVVYDTVARESYFRQGKVNILLQVGEKPDPHVGDVPLASALAKTEEDKQALNLFILRAALGRPFVMGPRVPAERVAAIRAAFASVMKDPDLLRVAQRSGVHPRFISADGLSDIIARAYATPPAAVARLKRAFGR